MNDWAEFEGLRMTWNKQAAQSFGCIHVPGVPRPGLGKTQVHTGGNGGYQAVNIAYLLGASRICLLGYDMQMTGQRTHWHGNHPKTSNPNAHMCKKWVSNFDRLYTDLCAEGVELVNCSRETALNVPRMDIDECLKTSPTPTT